MEHSPILPAGASLESFARFLPSAAGAAPLMAVAAALRGFNRDQLGSAIEVLIAVLDVADGDIDQEANGDEQDGSLGEDDFHEQSQNWRGIAGCPVSDPGEDDDPDTSVEDDPEGIDPEEDFGADDVGEKDEAEQGMTPDYGIDQSEPINSEMVAASDRLNTRPHRNRLRRTRCIPRYYRDYFTRQPKVEGYRLLEDPVAPTRRQLLRRKRGVPRRPRA